MRSWQYISSKEKPKDINLYSVSVTLTEGHTEINIVEAESEDAAIESLNLPWIPFNRFHVEQITRCGECGIITINYSSKGFYPFDYELGFSAI